MKLISGKPHLEIRIVACDAKIVALGPVGSSFDLQITGDAAACGDGVTVGSVKKELAEKHKIKWTDADFEYRLSKLHDGRAAEGHLDDDSERLDWGSMLMLFPTNPKKLLLLPPVQLLEQREHLQARKWRGQEISFAASSDTPAVKPRIAGGERYSPHPAGGLVVPPIN